MKIFKDLSDWIVVDDYCATRIVKGGDINNIADRVAFIESSPRVRVYKSRLSIEYEHGKAGGTSPKNDAWLYGDKGDNGFNEESRTWCDQMLLLLGWE